MPVKRRRRISVSHQRLGSISLECIERDQWAVANIRACDLDESVLAAEKGSEVGMAPAVLAVQPLCAIRD